MRATRTHALRIIEGIFYWPRGGGLADRLLRRITYGTKPLITIASGIYVCPQRDLARCFRLTNTSLNLVSYLTA